MPENKGSENKSKDKKEWTFKNFEALLALPERLCYFLRLLLHLDKGSWDFMVSKIRQGSPYTEYSISKGRGKGRRYFAAPCAELKKVQKAVLNRFLLPIPVHFCRHGGQIGSSILSNAEAHTGAKTVFAVDIVNAFPSVYRSRVRACLKKPFDFVLRQFAGVNFTKEDRDLMLETIVDLLIWKDRLPQGPPTSPRVFDIVCGKMDFELFDLVQKSSSALQTYTITVYVDNISISSNEAIPEDFRKDVVKIISQNGFYVHSREDKMAYFSKETGTVPVITGLVILSDGRILMHPHKVNQIRGTLNRLCKTPEWNEVTKGQVAGLLGFVRQIYPVNEKKLPSALTKPVAAAEARLGRTPQPGWIDKIQPEIPADAKALKEKKSQKKVKGKKAKAKKGDAKGRLKDLAVLPEATPAVVTAQTELCA